MIDIEKVIKGLQCIIDGTVRCESCGYAIDKHGHYSCQQECAKDAIALLKEQEPKSAIITHQNDCCKDGKCPSCWHELDDNMHPKYCGYCGQAVKWK